MENKKRFTPGQPVTYIAYEGAEPEHGQVSSVRDLPNGTQRVWVKYNKNTGSTGQLTPTDKLH